MAHRASNFRSLVQDLRHPRVFPFFDADGMGTLQYRNGWYWNMGGK